MIEAQIICCNPCDIRDLGIEGLCRGEERWVTLHAANSSKDLLHEQRKGNIRVYRKVRKEKAAPKRPHPPFVAGSRPQVIKRPVAQVPRPPTPEPLPAPDPPPAPEPPPAPQVNTSEIADKVRADLLNDLLPGLREAISQEVSKAVSSNNQQHSADPAPQQQGLDATQLEAVFEKVVRRMAPVGGSSSGQEDSRKIRGPEEPLFIPKSLVDKNTKGKITVSSKKSEGSDDIDSASDALRALKRAGRGRKKGSEDK